MFNKKRLWKRAVLALVMVMVLVIATPVFAQDEVDPGVVPTTAEESSKFLDHPIVKLIAEFFADLISPPVEEVPEPEVDGTGSDIDDPDLQEPLGDVLLEGDSDPETGLDPETEPVRSPEEVVASMHEDEGFGFGEIVKLMGIYDAICSESEEPCAVSLEDLKSEYKEGTGMGALFEKFGKPEYLGQGQIRRQLNPKEKVKSNNGLSKGKNK